MERLPRQVNVRQLYNYIIGLFFLLVYIMFFFFIILHFFLSWKIVLTIMFACNVLILMFR